MRPKTSLGFPIRSPSPMFPSVSSEHLRHRPSNELCFLVLSLPTVTASPGVRYHVRSDFSPHRTSSVSMAASFRASTLRPDARALPRFGALCSPGAPPPAIFQPPTRERSPGFTHRFFRTAQSGKTSGASMTVHLAFSTVTAGGFPTLRSLAMLARGLIHRFNLSAYSSALCLLAHCTSPHGDALPILTTSSVRLRRGLDFNQLEAGITPRHIATAEGRGTVSDRMSRGAAVD